MALTPAQLAHYRERGYTLSDCLLKGTKLAELQSQVDALIGNLPTGQRPENMPSVHYENPYFRDLFLSPPLVDVAAQILGPDIALFTSYIISKRPQDGLPVEWHQDAAYFPIEPMETFTLWLAVDDSTAFNGCMQVLPGTHRGRQIMAHNLDQERRTTLPLSIDPDTSAAVDVELEAGAFSLHDAFLWHGSNPNRSDRRRCGITIKYVPTYVEIDRTFVSPSGFDWRGLQLFLARGKKGKHEYANQV